MTTMLDLLSSYLDAREVQHCRIDGSISWQARAACTGAARGACEQPPAGAAPLVPLISRVRCLRPVLAHVQDRQEAMKQFNTDAEVGGVCLCVRMAVQALWACGRGAPALAAGLGWCKALLSRHCAGLG